MGWGRKRGSAAKEKGAKATEIDVEAKALTILAMRDHAVGELRKKLKERYYPDKHIDAVIERFTEMGYLNDERTAERFAKSLVRQGWGPMKIRIKMKQKGYTSECIDDTMLEVDDDATWLESATDRLESKFRKEPSELDDKEMQKAYRHLSYRGFPGGIIRKILFN